MSVLPLFHSAFAVTTIELIRAFYVEKLGCKAGRAAKNQWHRDDNCTSNTI